MPLVFGISVLFIMLKGWTIYTADMKCGGLRPFEVDATLIYQQLLVNRILNTPEYFFFSFV